MEVQQPTDPHDFYTFAWRTRYIYDLTQGGTVMIGNGPAYRAYGGLAKTQELLPNGVANPQWNEPSSSSGASTGTGNPVWQDTTGTAYDALERPLVTYRNTGSGMMPVTSTYDGGAFAGLLTQQCNANLECQAFEYNARGAKLRTTFNVASSSTQNFGYDEDGRLVSTSNDVGSISDSYNASGLKTTRVETVAPGQPATIRYWYAADGMRSSLDISTTSQNLVDALVYTYRADGLPRSISAVGQILSLVYSGGHRLMSRADSTGQPGLTFSYANVGASPSSYGLVQSINAPGFYETNMAYNPEGGQTGGGFWVNNGSGFFPGHLVNAVYTSRGETVVDVGGGAGSLYANGTRIQTATSNSSDTPKTAAFTFNAFQGFPTHVSSANSCGSNCVENDYNWGYGYDASGRQVAAAYVANPDENTTFTNTKSYDAEDHITGVALPWIQRGRAAYSRSLSYRWGAAGHPLQIGATSAVSADSPSPTDFQYDSLYWDDDSLLFTVGAGGLIDDVKVADVADYVPGATTPLTVWDRDIDGQIYGCHTAGGAYSITYSVFQNATIGCSASGSSFVTPGFNVDGHPVGRGGMLTMPKSDGYNDGQHTFQGPRAYDPQAGAWTTPDAFHGRVHDPMSQKPFMWNRNNPYAYSDPSGYDWKLALDNYEAIKAFSAVSPALGASLFYALATAKPLGGADEVEWMARDSLLRAAARQGAQAVIGVYGTRGDYLYYAAQFKLKAFNIPMGIWNKMTSIQQWAANDKWMRDGAEKGWTFIVVRSLDGTMNPSSDLAKEIKILMEDYGYVWNDEGTALIPKPK